MTGPDVVPEQTVRDLAAVLRPLGPVDRVELLTGGMFATTYRATLSDGTRVVVKTAPTDTDRLLRYEHDLLRTEAAVYALAADRPDLLMPCVLLTDLSRTVLPSDVLVVSHLDGVPLVDAGELEPAVTDRVQRELGAFMARLHTVHGERFGYPNLDAGLHAATWTEAFESMVEALLLDAGRWGTPLPSDEIRTALVRHRPALDDVRVPALVHTDLWAGNLFVDPPTGALLGVIDTERSVWGDPARAVPPVHVPRAARRDRTARLRGRLGGRTPRDGCGEPARCARSPGIGATPFTATDRARRRRDGCAATASGSSSRGSTSAEPAGGRPPSVPQRQRHAQQHGPRRPP